MTEYAYGMWVVAAFNLGLFLIFISGFLVPRGWAEWRNMGVLTAFLTALFAEMYGFPLTIFLLTRWLGEKYPVLNPFSHQNGHLLAVALGGSDFVWWLVMFISNTMLAAGFILMWKGWRLIFAARGKLVTGGVYAYARHPQYTGLLIITGGFMIQWPTIITLAMWPVLIFAYIRLARSEERDMAAAYGKDYIDYANRTPAFFPRISLWKNFLVARA